MAYKLFLRQLIIMSLLLLWVGSVALSQSTSMVDIIRDSIQSSDCQRTCWLGIEPGITTVDELEVILQNLDYPYYKQTQLHPEAPTYYIDWFKTDNIPYDYIRPESSTVIYTNESGFVSAVFISVISGISLDDALELFDEPSDIVGVSQSYANYRLYTKQQVVITATIGSQRVIDEMADVVLINSARVDYLLSYEDIRPCTEPIAICNTPLQAPTLNPISDTTNANPTISWSAENGVEAYLVSISSTTTIVKESFVATHVCSASDCSTTLSQPLAPDTYAVAVQGVNNMATSEWSNVETLRILPSISCDHTTTLTDHFGLTWNYKTLQLCYGSVVIELE